MKVTMLKHCASDLDVVNAARVSFAQQHFSMEKGDDKLIGFLMRNRHGTPFEHTYFRFHVEAPISVFREWHRHRVGHCLPGSALITTQRNNDSSQRPISELWELANVGVTDSMGRTRLLPSCKHPSLRILRDDGEFDTAEALDIYKSGVKPILKIEHERGTLRCTADHRIYTTDGWRRAGDLVVGDIIGTQGRVWRENERSIPPSLRSGIGVWTSMQRIVLIKTIDNCYKCGGEFSFDELELDHVIPVRDDLTKALDIGNLKPCCVACHAHKTFFNEQPSRDGQGRLGVISSSIFSIEDDGEEETYDIEMSGDIHNFVADGVVVHNSYNEMSGRYVQLPKKFYKPEKIRVQLGKPGAYTYEDLDPNTMWGRFRLWCITKKFERQFERAYKEYERLLKAGVAKEQARQVLPVGIYSQMWWSCNARSLMHFLSLRNKPDAMKEIRDLAGEAEEEFKKIMPITAEYFIESGRVAP